MEYDLRQALLDMTWDQFVTQETSVYDQAKDRSYTHVGADGRLPTLVPGLRQMPKKEFELGPAPPQEFLGKKTEPYIRDAVERIVQNGFERTNLNWVRPDHQPFQEQVERVNPQQAHVDARSLPVSSLQPEFNKTIEYGRAPNPTVQPLSRRLPERLGEAREVTVLPKRAENLDAGYSGAPRLEHGADDSRYLFMNLLKNPLRSEYLENPTPLYVREGLFRAEDEYGHTNGLRFKSEDHIHENRAGAMVREDLGVYRAPDMFLREKELPFVELRTPGADRLGVSTMDNRELSFAVEKSGKREVDRTTLRREPVLFVEEKGMYFENRTNEHLVAEYVELLARAPEPLRTIERDDILDDLQTVLLRNNPFHVRYA